MNGPNFSFLKSSYPELCRLGNRAEAYVCDYPQLAVIQLEPFIEIVLNHICRFENLVIGASVHEQIDRLISRRAINTQEADFCRLIHQATSEDNVSLTTEEVLDWIGRAHSLACRFYKEYNDSSFEPLPYLISGDVRQNGLDFDSGLLFPTTEKEASLADIDKKPVVGEWNRAFIHLENYTEVSGNDGDKYVGQWKAGRKHGAGKYTWHDGTVYEGEWKDDLEHGRGTKRYANGDVYTGQWEEGMFNGEGVYQWHDGTVYEGSWHDHMEHGRGTKTFPDGTILTGLWSYGEFLYSSEQACGGLISGQNGEEKLAVQLRYLKVIG
ncbi:type I restriction enzyme EcoKI subunit R [Chlamydia abortus]|nr:type I restriction enzyme EcoKI subunit R [Chlamydia abortus]